MKVYRAEEKDVSTLEYADVISFDMKDGEHVEAIVIAIEGGAAVCTFVDALEDDHCMNENWETKGGYLASDMRKYLNGELLDRFPDEIRERLQQDNNGDYLRLFSEKEVFGENYYSDESEADVEQYYYFKNRKNRIALSGHAGEYRARWWLRDVASSTSFALVYGDGNCYGRNASDSRGVRPAFLISMER